MRDVRSMDCCHCGRASVCVETQNFIEIIWGEEIDRGFGSQTIGISRNSKRLNAVKGVRMVYGQRQKIIIRSKA